MNVVIMVDYKFLFQGFSPVVPNSSAIAAPLCGSEPAS